MDDARLRQSLNPTRLERVAVRHFARAAAIRKSANSIVDPIDQPQYERMIDQLQAELGAEKFDAIWTETQTTHFDE